SRDEALSLPTEDSVRTALRTQQVIAHESGVANSVDPLAGSYFIEELTDRIEAQASDLIGKIDKSGGVVAAIEDGFIQRQIENSAYEYQQEIEKGERIIVGVNEFKIDEQTKPSLLRVNPEVESAQVKCLKELRRKRDNKKVEETLANLAECARNTSNLMPEILAAVKAYATLGEICQVLRDEFGEYRG
ncbi:MAG: methylmalonyl-CoA mutase family protein, partial [Desulfobacteraceae bacterium]|nr:methylmalonyl-CoA mutase family protein [Desulfobacteraceae bacterium]